MSPTPPADLLQCTRCGHAWYARTDHAWTPHGQHEPCARCGSPGVAASRDPRLGPTADQQPQGGGAAPVVNVNVNVNTGSSTPPRGPQTAGPAGWGQWSGPGRAPESSATRWGKSPRFWFFALPLATGGLASWVPPLWVASKVHEGQLKVRLYAAAAAAAGLAAVGGVLVACAPEDALGSASGPLADAGSLVLLIAVGIGTGVAVLYRHRVFPEGGPAASGTSGQPHALPGVQEARARRQRRAQYRNLADTDAALPREMHLGRPDRAPAFDDGGLVDLNALNVADLQRHAHVTAAEAASIVSTREKLGRLSSVDELVVHGDLTLTTAERLREYAVFIG